MQPKTLLLGPGAFEYQRRGWRKFRSVVGSIDGDQLGRGKSLLNKRASTIQLTRSQETRGPAEWSADFHYLQDPPLASP
ncbi:hypothetical protein RRG08_017554 [Elysia crispata]|uniref:Uncharacterized protein n=1 Tax=Elysia crispata TaxID=231223 RepID=A0AAE1AAQ0_9GAST|nr:hypothetical protein RRG08_017554 [Elysia crispata]